MLILNYLFQLQKINIIKIFLIVYEYYYPYEKIFDWIEFAFALLYECLISFYFINKLLQEEMAGNGMPQIEDLNDANKQNEAVKKGP